VIGVGTCDHFWLPWHQLFCANAGNAHHLIQIGGSAFGHFVNVFIRKNNANRHTDASASARRLALSADSGSACSSGSDRRMWAG
jgi:hypothetical protein